MVVMSCPLSVLDVEPQAYGTTRGEGDVICDKTKELDVTQG